MLILCILIGAILNVILTLLLNDSYIEVIARSIVIGISSVIVYYIYLRK